MGICLTQPNRPVAVATVVSKLLEHFTLSSMSPFLGTTDNQFGFKAGHGTDQCTFSVEANYFILRKPWFISACCFFRCRESIRSSIRHEIVWETNSKKGANVFCAAAETLVQGTNDAYEMGQIFVLYSALAASIKHYKYTCTSTKNLTWGGDAEKPEGYFVKVSLKIV